MTLPPRDVPRETTDRLKQLLHLVFKENKRQNLIATGTVADAWQRHVEDSLQLLRLAPATGLWVDIGTGAGFPGLVVAVASPDREVVLAEPRKLRADFLRGAIDELKCRNARVIQQNVQAVCTEPPAVLSARAVASLDRLFTAGNHLADSHTTWLMMKGRNAESELAAARERWQGDFRIEPSLTDPDAGIVVARGVKKKAGRR